MGQTTPNISIYIPTAGETNYDQSFSSGMVNIDQHDHSGGPTKGVPLSSAGISDGSITYPKLATNVVDTTTGLGTHGGGLANQIYLKDPLATIYTLAVAASTGFVALNSTTPTVRTITGTANQVSVANGAGVAGNPTLSLPSTIYTNISFDSGTNTLSAYTTGTFTPILRFGGATTGITYGTQAGKYWKIGAVVYFSLTIVLTNKGSATGTCTVAGLPFAVANDTFDNALSIVPSFASAGPFTAQAVFGTSNVAPLKYPAGSLSVMDDTDFANTSQFIISGFYWTS